MHNKICIDKGTEIIGQVTAVNRSSGGQSCRLTFDKLILPQNQSLKIFVAPMIKGSCLTIHREGQPVFLDCSNRINSYQKKVNGTADFNITNISSRKGRSFSLLANDEMILLSYEDIRMPNHDNGTVDDVAKSKLEKIKY